MCVYRLRIQPCPWTLCPMVQAENGPEVSVRIDRRYDRDSIRSTKLKSRVVCHDTNLLFAEAPEAYKNVEQVIASLEDYGLIDVVATLRPLLTFKG